MDKSEQCVRDEKQHDYEPHHGQPNVHHNNDEQRKRRKQQKVKLEEESILMDKRVSRFK